MRSVLLTKEQERQVRFLKFDREVESEFQDKAADDRIVRIRIVMVLLVLLMLPDFADGGPTKILANWINLLVNVTAWVILALVFVPWFRRAAVYALPVWSLLQHVGIGMMVKGANPWMQACIDLSLSILIVAAVRAPAKLAFAYTALTLFLRILFWQLDGGHALSSIQTGTMLFFGFFFLVAGALLTEYADRRAFLVSKSLEAERAKTQALLTNVLPAEIAEKLKASPDVLAEHHDAVTILFADVANFTPFAAGKSPAEVVGFLNQLFTRWDAVVEQAGLTKIKTVGDAYMVGGGLPTFRADHVAAMADLALEMRGVASAIGAEVRFGIHAGPAVAGVIGSQRYTYDVWGATVNMAARLQTQAATGEILVSSEVREALAASHESRAMGVVPLKGIGAVEVFVLLRRVLEPVPLSKPLG